jgi:hypothetical protein
VSAASAPTIAARSVVAVDAEYCQKDGTFQTAVRPRAELAEHDTDHRADQRQQPEAARQVLPQAERGAPGQASCSETSYCRAIATRTSSSASIR